MRLWRHRLSSPAQPISLSSDISCIKQIIVDPAIQHARTAAVYQYADYSESRDRCAALSRKDGTLLAQLRSEHSMHLKAYKHLLDASVDPNRSKCGEAPHWLDCPRTLQARMEIVGTTDWHGATFSVYTLSTLGTVNRLTEKMSVYRFVN